MTRSNPSDQTEKPLDLQPGDLLTEIAQRVLGIKTLETRHSDRLDFHEIGVASLHRALLAAYEAGRQSVQ